MCQKKFILKKHNREIIQSSINKGGTFNEEVTSVQ